MAYVEMLRVTSGVGMLSAMGFNTVVFATKYSGAPTLTLLACRPCRWAADFRRPLGVS